LIGVDDDDVVVVMEWRAKRGVLGGVFGKGIESGWLYLVVAMKGRAQGDI
jgi:hypothetical protein